MAEVVARGTGGGGLGSRAARWALISTGALYVVSGTIDGTFVPLEQGLVAALAVSLVGAVVLTTPGSGALDPKRSLFVAVCAPVSGALLLNSTGVPGEIWMFSFSSYLSALLITRGNIFTGLLSGAAVLVTGVVAGALSRVPFAAVLEVLAVPVMALLTGVVWYLLLRHLVARELSFRAEAARAAFAANLARESAIADAREMSEIGAIAAPLLRAVADGTALDEPLHRELAVAEAAIRDRIRSPGFQYPALVEAITGFRSRGGRLLLLGDSAEPVGSAVAEALVGVVSGLAGGDVTIRELPSNRSGAVTVRVADASGTELITFADDGTMVKRQ